MLYKCTLLELMTIFHDNIRTTVLTPQKGYTLLDESNCVYRTIMLYGDIYLLCTNSTLFNSTLYVFNN